MVADIRRPRHVVGMFRAQPGVDAPMKIRGGAREVEATPEARRYALKELARRAGVTAEQFRDWRIEVGDDLTTVFPVPGSACAIRFPNLPGPLTPGLRERRSMQATWLSEPPPGLRDLVPHFVIPFVTQSGAQGRPLFHRSSPAVIDCSCDLPLSTLLTLSRWEETLEGERDKHGRFASTASVSARDNFLHRPVVDEYGFALQQVLILLTPGWTPERRSPAVKISHDIDHIGMPWNPRQALGHTIRRRRPLATLRDITAPITGLRPTLLALVHEIVRQTLSRGLQSAVYWKGSRKTPFDSGYDPGRPLVRRTISWLREHGVECGVHPGYDTFGAAAGLAEEVRSLRRVLGEGPVGGRQHYLRWHPQTWEHWEACGLGYDSTVGYADRVGFRAGTCFPYRPWLLGPSREASIIELPLIVMDGTLYQYMSLSAERAVAEVRSLLERCDTVGGVFTLLWHNGSLIAPGFGAYRDMLDALTGRDSCDWRRLEAW
jgi:hypothetical protein